MDEGTLTAITIILGLIFTLCMLIVVWFIPVFCSRGNENANKILWLTIFLGWIPLVWLVLLIAALLGRKKNS
ncbi:hypothetical protein IKQ26_05255 [bacterium]|nr:hypothetical protein [bacterium]